MKAQGFHTTKLLVFLALRVFSINGDMQTVAAPVSDKSTHPGELLTGNADKTWNGSLSDWHTANNWIPPGVSVRSAKTTYASNTATRL